MPFYLKLMLGIFVFGIISHFVPSVFASDFGPGPAGIPQLQYLVARLVCISVPIGFTAMFVVLVITGIKFITSGGEAKAIQSANLAVTWAFLGILFMAIAWLVLLLIQNVTGTKVTEFNLATLPGVQGFSGSCWAPPPTSPVPQQPAITSVPQPVTQQSYSPPEVECHNSSEIFVEADENYLNQRFISGFRRPGNFIVYTPEKPEDIAQLANVLEEPTWIFIFPSGTNSKLYHYNPNFLQNLQQANPYIIQIPIGESDVFAKFPKGYPFADFIEAKRVAMKVAQDIYNRRSQQGIIPGFSQSVGNSVTFHIDCDDGDFYPLVSYSPLIYLYPQKNLEIQVELLSPITSSLKMTQGQWNVTAQPNGTLTTLEGKKHKFIPYEFLRNNFKRPTKGSVIEGSKLEEYLRNDLWRRLGLTESEINDYWWDVKPRVKQSPYYFVSLIERSEIDRVLPMEVNPKPDTVIRNMTYILPLLSKPLQNITPLDNNEIVAPKRDGFTVLENGVFVDGF